MPGAPTFDLDLLRTLAAIAEEASFTRAAERIGRTQSAVSLQVQRLEAFVGHPLLLRRKGGAVELTEHGRILVEQGSRLLALNDEILAGLRMVAEPARVRLGASEDHSQLYLPRLLERFSETHPAVSVEIASGPSCQLVQWLKAGELDLMLCEGGHEPRGWPATLLWSTPLCWITSARHTAETRDPLPLALSPDDCPFRPDWLDACVWRGAAERALSRAGRRYRIVATASSVAGQQAVVKAGLALTVGSPASLVPGLRLVDPAEGLPELPETEVLLLTSPEAAQPVTDALAAHLAASFGPAMDDAAAAALAAAAG